MPKLVALLLCGLWELLLALKIYLPFLLNLSGLELSSQMLC